MTFCNFFCIQVTDHVKRYDTKSNYMTYQKYMKKYTKD